MGESKILIAYGPHGKNDLNFNWCNDREPVGVHGMVCCNSDRCGCNRSFQGIDSSKSTTMAMVVDACSEPSLPNSSINRLKTRLTITTLKRWNYDADITQDAVDYYDWLLNELRNFEVGDVLTVKKSSNGSIILKKVEVSFKCDGLTLDENSSFIRFYPEKNIDLLYEFANHVRNTDNMPPLMWGVNGVNLLAKLRELDSSEYDKRVKHTLQHDNST